MGVSAVPLEPAPRVVNTSLICAHLSLSAGRAEILLDVATEPLCRMLRDTDQAGVEAAAWLLGYLATDPANGRPLIALGAAPALVR